MRACVLTVSDGVFHGAREDGSGDLLGYVASRAHHSDVGGMSPGSMPLASEIYQEGFRLPPMKISEAAR